MKKIIGSLLMAIAFVIVVVNVVKLVFVAFLPMLGWLIGGLLFKLGEKLKG